MRKKKGLTNPQRGYILLASAVGKGIITDIRINIVEGQPVEAWIHWEKLSRKGRILQNLLPRITGQPFTDKQKAFLWILDNAGRGRILTVEINAYSEGNRNARILWEPAPGSDISTLVDPGLVDKITLTSKEKNGTQRSN